MKSNVANEIDDNRSHRVCRWSIEIAIGLFYAMLVAVVVSFFATAYIEISQKEFESLFGKGWRFVSIHDWHLTLPTGVWILIFPGGILVGLISGATRGRLWPPAITGLVVLLGYLVVALMRRWDAGGELWHLAFAQAMTIFASACICPLVLKLLQVGRRAAHVSLSNGQSPGIVLSTLSIGLVISAIVGSPFVPAAPFIGLVMYAAAFAATLHLTAVYPNREPLASRLRGIMLAWLVLIVSAFLLIARGSVHGTPF